jgi:hypothetical protein
MKIGFSFGKCVRDIVNGTVDINDVVVIVARTRFRDASDIEDIILEYANRQDYLRGLNIEECQRVASKLYNEGKIHQPREFGQYFSGTVSQDYVWMDLFPTNNSDNPMVQKAWDTYRMLMKLGSTAPIPNAQGAAEEILRL